MNGPEQLSAWYLRLNGYLITTNFYAHARHKTLGEIDVTGVRFPYSQELNFEDDLRVLGKTDVVLVESEKGDIDAENNPWKSRTKEALEYALRRVGIVPRERLDEACKSVCESGNYTRDDYSLRAICCGRSMSVELEKRGITCVKWAEMLKFIQNRFRSNERLRRQHEQWDCFGKYLWKQLNRSSPPDEAKFFCEWEKIAGTTKRVCDDVITGNGMYRSGWGRAVFSPSWQRV